MHNRGRTDEGTQILTAREAALRLLCGVTTIYELMRHGELPYLQYFRGRRIEARALEEFISRHRISPRTPASRWRKVK